MSLHDMVKMTLKCLELCKTAVKKWMYIFFNFLRQKCKQHLKILGISPSNEMIIRLKLWVFVKNTKNADTLLKKKVFK